MTRYLVQVSVLAFFFGAPLVDATRADDTPPPGVKVASLPQPTVGSYWVIEDQNGKRTRIELLKVDGDGFIAKVGQREVRYTSEWNALEGHNARLGDTRYVPHTRLLSFPLWEGKKWGGGVLPQRLERRQSRAGTSGSGFYQVSGEAMRWETVEVPAGTLRL